MYYAPVLIPTLNRYDHFVRLVESLQKNEYAKFTELYVGLDYPPSEKYNAGYSKIADYLNVGISGFKEVNIIKYKENIGAASNINSLLTVSRKKYDIFILLEDDNFVSPNFLEYMYKSLELMGGDNDISAVCGYSYPVNWYSNSSNIIKEQSFFSGWGFGTYFTKIDEIRETFRRYSKDKVYISKLKDLRKKSKKNYAYFLGMAYHDRFVENDIGISCYQSLENKYCLMPIISKVRNEGYDGSGINCPDASEWPYQNQSIDNNLRFCFSNELRSSKQIEHYLKNERIINNYYPVSFKDYLKAVLKEIMIRIKRK